MSSRLKCSQTLARKIDKHRALVELALSTKNAEAECSIQTVMYMVRHFMIHAALNWGEDGSDNMAVWSFALNHAAYLCNRIL